MPPRLNLLAVSRAFPIRTKAPIERWRPTAITQLCTPRNRGYVDSSKDLPISPDQKGPNTEQNAIPHVSEEAAAMKKSMGQTPPELEQGTPIEEIVAGDKEAQAKLPKVMKDALKAQKPSNSRSFSTSAIRRTDPYQGYQGPMGSPSQSTDATIVASGNEQITDPASRAIAQGVKFGLPTLPLPANYNLHHRYDPLIDQMVGLLIQHGKKDVARRNMDIILSHLRTSPPPKINPDRPLLPGHPPPSHLPLNPILYLSLAIDSIAPLLRIRQQRGAAGGGVALALPIPLSLRRRRWTAINWILEAASKRKSRGSGKSMFATRIAEEIVAVVEGKSAIWVKREGLHKLGVAARANMMTKRRR